MGSNIEETTNDNFFGMGPMSWMTSDNEVEIRPRSMEDEIEREVLCRNFSGHWSTKHKRFFRIPNKRVLLDKEHEGLG